MNAVTLELDTMELLDPDSRLRLTLSTVVSIVAPASIADKMTSVDELSAAVKAGKFLVRKAGTCHMGISTSFEGEELRNPNLEHIHPFGLEAEVHDIDRTIEALTSCSVRSHTF